MISKLDLRETLDIPVSDGSTAAEIFQNQTLRPVLKLQNDLYLSLFKRYAESQNADFASLKITQKRTFVDQSLQKDSGLKNTLIGVTIGMFTPQELQTYSFQSKVYNRRIVAMIIERIKSQLK
ncbi:glyoxalase [Kaistella sp. 97-N-M2]|uniref:glyoxalase n=1 Tax=Kaistella sp. 97-N-M2 TaxID=2908645 RepID=UPI001F2AC0BA|nr:glyoxalase [Kaistella sp. 97-N-M2]UJF29617.1 glyoxalase [Kaistella sp. 97-N-M2]